MAQSLVGKEASEVYIPSGYLTTPVISTATLGLVYLTISHHLRFGLLAYWPPP
jgi:hypothetical protein